MGLNTVGEYSKDLTEFYATGCSGKGGKMSGAQMRQSSKKSTLPVMKYP